MFTGIKGLGKSSAAAFKPISLIRRFARQRRSEPTKLPKTPTEDKLAQHVNPRNQID
jgi:hypothetical protein